jgi:two-component system, NarL family, response regulator DevR
VILDLRMPGPSGLEVCRALRNHPNRPRVLILTAYANPATIREALKMGADAYVLKTIAPDDLMAAIKKIAKAPELPISVTLFDDDALGPVRTRAILTDKEREILNYLAQGLSNREIAATMNWQPQSVKNYVRRILKKLHAPNRDEAVARALDAELLAND